ncbi:hypothetical protein E4U43_006551 [Claviceps pusilla]|uniref:Uncharacterized protein n=1 Tax=Claviceps pusilla TaxID=123648 RepID=A0A9P7N3P0_9HYPO|nr:hypothetical protein E4U43_006551 [Claviceps pusilla]
MGTIVGLESFALARWLLGLSNVTAEAIRLLNDDVRVTEAGSEEVKLVFLAGLEPRRVRLEAGGVTNSLFPGVSRDDKTTGL